MKLAQRAALLLCIGLTIAVPISGRIPECGNEVDLAFDKFAQQIESSRESQQRVTAPSLQGCNPSLLLRRILAQNLSDAVLATMKSDQGSQMLWMAETLESVRGSFEQAGHPNDFHLLSETIFLNVHSELEGLPAIPPFEARHDFGGLEPLISALQKEARSRGVRHSSTAPSPPVPQDPPPEFTEPASTAPESALKLPEYEASNDRFLKIGLGALGVVLISLLLFLIRRAKRTELDAENEEDSDAGSTSFERSTLERPEGRPDFVLQPENRATNPVVSSGIDELRDRLVKLEKAATLQRASGAESAKLTDAFQALQKNHDDAVAGIARDLAKLDFDLKTLRQGLEAMRASQKSLEAKTDILSDQVRPENEETTSNPPEVQPAPSPLESQFQTEQALLKEDWKRFLATKKQLGELVRTAATEGEHKVLFDELLKELPRAVESVSQHGARFDAKLAPLQLYNQQLKRLQMVDARVQQEMPEASEAQLRRLLGLRDSAQLLATFRNTDAAEALLKFKPSEWCKKVLPELADLFVRDYQAAVAENRAQPLEEAYQAIIRALRIGDLELIEIIPGQTEFDSDIHDGIAPAEDRRYPNEAVVQVLKNGFRSLSDGRIVMKPKVTVNRV